MHYKETRNGVPLLPRRHGPPPISSELVQEIGEELPLALLRHSIRVELPAHLRTLARIPTHEVCVELAGTDTVRGVLDGLEAMYPALLGTIRDQVTGERRAFLRFFACQQDISFEPADAELPRAVLDGREPLIILGAVAGG